MNSQRYKYLDILKVFAIFCVCIYHMWHGHPWETFGFIRKYLYGILSTCVPLFFTVNGALLLNQKEFHGNKHFKKVLATITQFYLWNIITFFILKYVTGNSDLSLYQVVNAILFLLPVEGIMTNHFWFIPALCCIYFLYPFVRALFCQEHTDHSSRLSLIVLMGVSFFFNFFIYDFENLKGVFPFIRNLYMGCLWQFNPLAEKATTMLVYFLLGGFLHKYRYKTERVPAAVCIILILAGLLFSYVTGSILNHHEMVYDVVFDGYNSTGTFLCTIGIFLLALKSENRIPNEGSLTRVLYLVGNNTMTIYYTHWILGMTLFFQLPIGYGPFWNLLNGILLISVGTILGELLKRIPVLKYLVCR